MPLDKHLDDTSWLKREVVQEPHDAYYLQAVAALAEPHWQLGIARIGGLERLARGDRTAMGERDWLLQQLRALARGGEVVQTT